MTTLLPFSARLRDLTIGAGTGYDLTDPITGLGIAEARTNDLELSTRHGSAAGLDTLPARSIYFPLAWRGNDRADVMRKLRALKAAFGPGDPSTVEELELRLPGFTDVRDGDAVTFFGRPRGLVEDLSLLKSREGAALCRFDALDPIAYGPERTIVADLGDADVNLHPPLAGIPSTTVAVTNFGETTSTRIRVDFTATTTDPPALAWWANGEIEQITWLEPIPLAGPGLGGSRTVDFHDRTISYETLVSDGFGGFEASTINAYPEVGPASGWLTAPPGVVGLFVATDPLEELTVTVRSAYL